MCVHSMWNAHTRTGSAGAGGRPPAAAAAEAEAAVLPAALAPVEAIAAEAAAAGGNPAGEPSPCAPVRERRRWGRYPDGVPGASALPTEEKKPPGLVLSTHTHTNTHAHSDDAPVHTSCTRQQRVSPYPRAHGRHHLEAHDLASAPNAPNRHTHVQCGAAGTQKHRCEVKA